MLTYAELTRLERRLEATPVLSVYIDTAVRDPAQRHAWRTRVADGLRAARKAVSSDSRDEHDAFARAADHLETRLATFTDWGGARGWVAFVSANGVEHSEALPVRTPTGVVWDAGPRIALYAHVLTQRRPVILAEVNAERAQLYRYEDGALERLERLHAHVVMRSHDHMGDTPRLGFHIGTKGTAGTDEAERVLRAGTERMLRELVARLLDLAAADGWVIIGGTPQPAKAAMAALPASLSSRALLMPSMHIWSSDAEIRSCAESGASTLRDAHELFKVTEAIELAGQGGRGVLGTPGTLRALAAGAAEDLYLSERFLGDAPAPAEAAVRAALQHGTRPEIVWGSAGQLLDREGDGIAAKLRYVTPAHIEEVAHQTFTQAPSTTT